MTLTISSIYMSRVLELKARGLVSKAQTGGPRSKQGVGVGVVWT